MVRSPATLAALLALAWTAPAAAERYHVRIAHDFRNQWLGVAELVSDPEGRVSGEMCIVARQTDPASAATRTLLRIPLSGRMANDGLDLGLPPVPGGPAVENGAAALTPTRYFQPIIAPEGIDGWEYGSEQAIFADPADPADPAGAAALVRYMLLTRAGDPAPGVQLSVLTDARDDQVAIRPEGDPDAPFAAVGLAIYDGLSREEAIAFEQRNQREMHYPPGSVLAIVDSANLERLQAALDSLGDGARIMNLELKDCPPTPLFVTVTVPPLLEFWYTRQLQRSGLVVTAYPEGLERDAGWTEPFLVRNAAVAGAFRNAAVPMVDKYRILWNVFERRLAQFAAARRPGFAVRGRITRLAGGPFHIFRAEISGPALAVCQASRWERIVIQASVGPPEAGGAIGLSIQMSEGFFGRGANPPSDSRLRDNRIGDDELERLQEILVGAIEGRGARAESVRCQQ